MWVEMAILFCFIAISVVIFGIDSKTSAIDLVFVVPHFAFPALYDFGGAFSASRDFLRYSREMRTVRIAKPVRTEFFVYNALWAISEKSRKMSAVAVYLRLFGHFVDFQVDTVVCTSFHAVASQDEKLIVFDDSSRSVLHFVER